MQVKQTTAHSPAQLAAKLGELAGFEADLLLVFGSVDYFKSPTWVDRLTQACPKAVLAGCSTAGEITADGVSDNSLTLTALRLEKTGLCVAETTLAGMQDSEAAGQRLGQQLAGAGVRAVLIFGPGLNINGSGVVDGLGRVLGNSTPITGGLAGDGGAFQQTFTLAPSGVADNRVVAVGLTGDALSFAHGSFGGWESFGPARKVTRSVDNVLYELDGEPALHIYKRYLGEYAKDLPASGLLFPFAMLGADHGAIGLIRTILGINEADGSLTLAGSIDPNGYLKLMHASTDKLVDGAEAAAQAAQTMRQDGGNGLAILISCVGRKLVMGDRIDEEIESVADVFGTQAPLTGFYSYGEISPFAPGCECKLHNQTMTITWLGEA